MVRMTFEPRVVDPFDTSVLLQESRDLERAFVLMTDAQRECLHSAKQQERCMRIHRSAQVVELVLYLFDQVGAANARPAYDVRMAVQVLCAAVQRKIEAS